MKFFGNMFFKFEDDRTREIHTLKKKIENRPLHWRIGQAAFNFAYDIDSEVADKLKNTDVDLYYDDKKTNLFTDAFIKERYD